MRLTNVVPGAVVPDAGKVAARALIVTADKFEDLEVVVPYFRLLESGVEVDIAAPSMDPIGGEHGYVLNPDTTIDQVDPSRYDLLVIPGGFPDGAPATVRDTVSAQHLARSFFDANKTVAAICHGPWLLATADVARGRHLTSYWNDGVPEDLRRAGALWEDAPVVVDGNLITSRWPPDLPAFTSAMISALAAATRPAAAAIGGGASMVEIGSGGD